MGRGGGLPYSLPWARPWVVLLLLGTLMSLIAAAVGEQETTAALGTIAYFSVGRARFAYDLFGLKLPHLWAKNETSEVLSADVLDEIKLTDGVSINYNGQLVEGEARLAVLERFRREGVNVADESSVLIFVSERDGSLGVYFQVLSNEIQTTVESELMPKLILGQDPAARREILESSVSKTQGAILNAGLNLDGPALFDRPSLVGDSIVYVSTKEPRQSPRTSSAAVYSTSLKSQTTTRLTPKETADFSPSVSPSGEWVAVTSSDDGFQGEVEEPLSDLYVYKAKDGSSRRLVMQRAGWPSWADDHTIFYHRKADDGWWSIFRVILPEKFLSTGEGKVEEERISPPGVHAITPAASRTGNWVAVATRRPGSKFRHVEIFVLHLHLFVKLTEKIAPQMNHYNPFVSSSGFVGYHRCRGNSGGNQIVPLVEAVRSPIPGLALVRIDGVFPSYSPDGSLLAFARNENGTAIGASDNGAGIFVCKADGSGVRRVFPGRAFCPSWDKRRKGVLYATVGRGFAFTDSAQIIALHNVDRSGEVVWKNLTLTGNNAFPSASPDGKHVVFRSMRSGFMNLYIMDAVDGEAKYLRRLTEGPWTDQHPNWSPDGMWIAFTSNREHPDAFIYSIYMIRPDGTGLHKVLQVGNTGLAVHPIFSPDSKKFVFASNLAADSGEPIAEPNLARSGQVFIVDVDGSNIKRLTHSFLEDGTPAWSPTYLSSSDLSTEGKILNCNVHDTVFLNSHPSYEHNSTTPSTTKLPPIQC